MKAIKAEGTQFIYFTQVDGYPKETEIHASVQGRHTFMKEKIEEGPRDIRAVLTKWIHPEVAFLQYLYWSDNTDLKLLDVAVEQGTFDEASFLHSVKTLYQVTICMSCMSKWHSLVIDTVAYFDVPGLAQKKVSEAKILLCPKCGAMLRQLVVKIWNEEK